MFVDYFAMRLNEDEYSVLMHVLFEVVAYSFNNECTSLVKLFLLNVWNISLLAFLTGRIMKPTLYIYIYIKYVSCCNGTFSFESSFFSLSFFNAWYYEFVSFFFCLFVSRFLVS